MATSSAVDTYSWFTFGLIPRSLPHTGTTRPFTFNTKHTTLQPASLACACWGVHTKVHMYHAPLLPHRNTCTTYSFYHTGSHLQRNTSTDSALCQAFQQKQLSTTKVPATTTHTHTWSITHATHPQISNTHHLYGRTTTKMPPPNQLPQTHIDPHTAIHMPHLCNSIISTHAGSQHTSLC